MKRTKWTYLLLMSVVLAASCRSDDRKMVAIRDFEPSLRPFLLKAVYTGIVGFDEGANYVESHISDKDLVLLGRSEHPILRAIALREMLRRQTFDHFRVIMEHLDDTATVAVDWGEWGIQFRTVSDYVIENAKWKTDADKKRTIDQIILKHDYLRSAYNGLGRVELQQKYYPHIKKMAQRDVEFDIRQEALFALAKFRKREDVPFIKEILLQNDWRMQNSSWQLIIDFPDTSYMEVLQKYYRHRFYRIICREQDLVKAGDYIKALASYRSDSSASIFNKILNKRPMMPCVTDTNYLRKLIIRSIWDNPCPAYAGLRRQITAKMRTIFKKEAYDSANSISIENIEIPKDTASEPVYW